MPLYTVSVEYVAAECRYMAMEVLPYTEEGDPHDATVHVLAADELGAFVAVNEAPAFVVRESLSRRNRVIR